MANFYPRPPRGGRPDVTVQPLGAEVFLSTPSARRATRCQFSLWQAVPISIHALREEGDLRYGGVHRRCDISIHALREEGDITDHSAYLAGAIFLSTPSARRATFSTWRPLISQGISIHALREEGDLRYGGVHRRCDISIHALREEGDITDHSAYLAGAIFLSTPSARRATEHGGLIRSDGTISIHALREEGDAVTSMHSLVSRISIHALREEGDAFCRVPKSHSREFLSTPSARRATSCAGHQIAETRISIHALREEGDALPVLPLASSSYFYPRPPRGGRRHLFFF